MKRAHRRLAFAVGCVAALAAIAVARDARADELVDPLGENVAEKELGARLGLQMGQGITPGGLRIGGIYLHRMTEETWFDAEVAFSFGGGDPVCYNDRDRELVCEPSLTSGVSGSAAVGGRWFPAQRASGFLPFLRAGLALEMADFGGDDVRGWALPAWAAVGGRFRVGGSVAISAEVHVAAGPALYDNDLGLRGYGHLLVQFGVDLGL